MEYKSDSVLDLQGNAVVGANVLVLNEDKATPADLFDPNGNSIRNPISTGTLGEYSFSAANGKYYLQISFSGRVLRLIGPISLYDPTGAAFNSSQIEFTPKGFGSVPTPVQEKLRERISLSDKGAVTDYNGIIGTDTALAINRSLVPGCSVYAMSGPHYLAGSIDVVANSSIIGDETTRMGQPGNWINLFAELEHGTTFFSDVGKGSGSADPLFRLRVGSQIKNINVWNPGQTKIDSAGSIIPYPPAFFIGQEAGSGGQNSDNVMLENIAALNCYEFMQIGNGTESVGRPVVKNFYANPLHKGLTLNTINGDMFHLEQGYIENIFLTNQTDRPNLFEHIRRNVIAYDINDAQGGTVTNCTALCMGVGFKTGPRSWVHYINPVADQCALPFWINGADRVSINGGASVNNFKVGGPSMLVEGVVNSLTISNHVFGAKYPGIKTGVYAKHTSGIAKITASTFETSYPAVLNVGGGGVSINACGIGYDRVVGKNISVDGGPVIALGPSVPLVNLNPSVPVPLGWTISNATQFTAIPGGISAKGVGSYGIHYRPADVSVSNLDLLRWSNGMFVLEFDYYVTGQGGSAAMQMEILNDGFTSICDMFQICSDQGQASGFPEGETMRMAVILPWNVNATLLHFSFNNQDGVTEHRLSNFVISKLSVPRGCTGLEFFKWAVKLPSGHFDAHTGKQVMFYGAVPSGGFWQVGDTIINPEPAAGAPSRWKCVAAPSTFAVAETLGA